jgi:hypothetical protein
MKYEEEKHRLGCHSIFLFKFGAIQKKTKKLANDNQTRNQAILTHITK